MRKFLGNLIFHCLRHADTTARINAGDGWRYVTFSEGVLNAAEIIKQINQDLQEQKRKLTQMNSDFFQHEVISSQRLLKLEENIPLYKVISVPAKRTKNAKKA